MDINRRNKKVALSRWNKIQNKEKIEMQMSIRNNLNLKARICGYLVGDGSVIIKKDNRNNLHHIIKFSLSHESLIKSFVQTFKIIYKKSPKITKYGNYYELSYYSKTAAQDLLNTTNFGVLMWRVPFKILKTKEAKAEWLRAFFDSECCVNKRSIKIQCVSKNGIMDIKKLLLDFGINGRKYVYIPKNKRWNAVHILFINKKVERIKFLNEVGLNHLVKLKKLKSYAVVA